jgi:hypothetical membrane protein
MHVNFASFVSLITYIKYYSTVIILGISVQLISNSSAKFVITVQFFVITVQFIAIFCLTRKHENEVAGIVGILVYISDTKFC